MSYIITIALFFLSVSKYSLSYISLDDLTSSESSQPAITCSKLTIETLEQGEKNVQSSQ